MRSNNEHVPGTDCTAIAPQQLKYQTTQKSLDPVPLNIRDTTTFQWQLLRKGIYGDH